jgi:hypothetical protein
LMDVANKVDQEPERLFIGDVLGRRCLVLQNTDAALDGLYHIIPLGSEGTGLVRGGADARVRKVPPRLAVIPVVIMEGFCDRVPLGACCSKSES